MTKVQLRDGILHGTEYSPRLAVGQERHRQGAGRSGAEMSPWKNALLLTANPAVGSVWAIPERSTCLASGARLPLSQWQIDILAIMIAQSARRTSASAFRHMVAAPTVSTAARPAGCVAARHLSSLPQPPRKHKLEKGEIAPPEDNIEFKKTSVMDIIDRLANAVFLGEMWRGWWLCMEVRPNRHLCTTQGKCRYVVQYMQSTSHPPTEKSFEGSSLSRLSQRHRKRLASRHDPTPPPATW